MSDKEEDKAYATLNTIEPSNLEWWRQASRDTINHSYQDVPDFVTNIKEEILEGEAHKLKIKDELLSISEEQPTASKFVLLLGPIKTEAIERDYIDEWTIIDKKFDMKNAEINEAMEGSEESLDGLNLFKTEEVDIKTEEEDRTAPNNFDREQDSDGKVPKSHLNNNPFGSKNKKQGVTHLCTECNYQTQHRRNLRKHLVCHQTPDEHNLLKCPDCSYQTMRRSNLTRHALSHKNGRTSSTHGSPPRDQRQVTEQIQESDSTNLIFRLKKRKEVVMHRCTECNYQTEDKSNLKRHLVRHQTPNEHNLQKCNECSFQTMRLDTLRKHALRHKNVDEVAIYKCIECGYQTRRKDALIAHVRERHTSANQVVVYNCVLCSYQSKRKSDLKRHALRHENVKKDVVHKCNDCDYQTKRRCDLDKHVLRRHASIAEVTIYKCLKCDYKTKRKGYLNRHAHCHITT